MRPVVSELLEPKFPSPTWRNYTCRCFDKQFDARNQEEDMAYGFGGDEGDEEAGRGGKAGGALQFNKKIYEELVRGATTRFIL